MSAQIKKSIKKAFKACHKGLWSRAALISYVARHMDWLDFVNKNKEPYFEVYIIGEEKPFCFIASALAEEIMGMASLLNKEIESAIFDDKYEKTVQNFTFDDILNGISANQSQI